MEKKKGSAMVGSMTERDEMVNWEKMLSFSFTFEIFILEEKKVKTLVLD